jgi:hypothetical protein
MVPAIGVWAETQDGEIQIHISGTHDFHVIVVDNLNSKRHHSAPILQPITGTVG